MRMTRLVAKTLREAPSDAEAISHQLLVRAGYIRRVASGIYSYLPLGLRVLRKIENIIRQEFDNVGAQEVLLPAVQPLELWEETNRSTTMDDVLMRLEVRGGKFVLGPTHEEAVIATVSHDLASYRDLPATVYQIQTKFRDEARPRYGLLRTREFIMADAYSFDVSKETMRVSYDKMFDAYCRAFDRIGVEYHPVEADAGSIGGDVNHEFMVPAAIGEDYFARCVNCGYKANIEAAKRFSKVSNQGFEGSRLMSEIFTGPTLTVEAAIKEIEKLRPEITAADMIKSIVLLDEKGALVLALVPGDRKVRIPPGMKALDNTAFASYSFLHLGYVGPMEMQERGVRVLADHSIGGSRYWTTGGNRREYHVLDVVRDRDFTVDEYLDLVVVEDGDLCPKCQDSMNLVRSVEAGHTFQLGLTYPEKIASARFSADDGVESMYYMGCYGIGVSRLPAVVAEVSNDAAGLVWPVSVAPYQVHIVSISYGKNPEVSQSSDLIYESLLAAGIEVLLDDRDVGPGVKLNDADLIGVPLQLVVGPKGLARGVIDLKVRASGEKSEMPVSEVVDIVRAKIAALLASVPPK